MPLGIVILLISVILLSFGYLDNLCFSLALNRKTAIILFVGIVFSYTLYPVTFSGVTVYLLPFILVFGFSVYLLIKSRNIKMLFLSFFSAVILWIVALKIPPQPIGLLSEPFIIYGLFLTALNVLFMLKSTFIILNSSLAICFFGAFMVLTKTHVSLLCHDAFSCICASSVLSFLFLKGLKKCT